MKKILVFTICLIIVLAISTSTVYATVYNYDSFTAPDGYGTKTQGADKNITNLKGAAEFVGGMKYGPYSKSSKGKLADGIDEETYIELKLDDFKQSEFFEVSLALKTMENEAEKYITEAVVMTQKVNDNEFLLSANWAPNFKARISEDGIYTYKWKMYTKEDTTYVEFQVLNRDKLLETTGEINLDEVKSPDKPEGKIADQGDVTVKYLWFCNVQVANGVNVYAELPAIDEPATDEPATDEPTTDEPTDPTPEKPTDSDEEQVSNEKDTTPKTGSINIAIITAIVSAISFAGIIIIKKYNK